MSSSTPSWLNLGARMRSAASVVFAIGLCACVTPKESSPEVQAKTPAAESLYATHCASCHELPAGQAPRREALTKLSAASIEAALTTGIMQSQAAGLSDAERKSLAAFLSNAQSTTRADAGRCATADKGRLAPVHVGDWGVDPENTRFIPAGRTAITPENAGRLKLAWAFALPESTRARVQPTLAGDTLFVASPAGVLYALNAGTGCIRWQAETGAEIRSALVIDADKAGKAHTLYFGDINGGVHAFDIGARTMTWSVRPEAHPQASITGAVKLHQGRLYVPVSSLEVVAAMKDTYPCCSFRGAVVALDARSGKTLWKTYTVAEPVKQAGVNRAGTPRFGPSGAPVWSSPTIDEQRRRIYVGTGENYSHPVSSTSDSILALDMDTGALAWRFQALADDAWNAACADGANCPANTGPDYDFGASPLLARAGGRSLVIAGQKSGFVYALDPDRQGALVWKTKVGRGGIMGGVHWSLAQSGNSLLAPVSDISVYPSDAGLPAQSGLHALNIQTGDKLWSSVLADECGSTSWRCSPRISAAIMTTPRLIFAGSLDGSLRVFDASSGAVLWRFDTSRKFQTVNGYPAEGGSIDASGPIVSGDKLYATSGYDKFGQKPGNVVLAFELSE